MAEPLSTAIQDHKVVTQSEWIASRQELLLKEKEFTKLRDELSRQRRELPWERVEKLYAFDGPSGKLTLSDLFSGCSQLIVYHFMFGPEWKEGCPSCSFLSDHDGTLAHLNHHDVTLLAISRAPLLNIEAFKKRMGWRFPWVSSHDSDFNFDYHVSATKDELAKGGMYYDRRTAADGPREGGTVSTDEVRPALHRGRCATTGLCRQGARKLERTGDRANHRARAQRVWTGSLPTLSGNLGGARGPFSQFHGIPETQPELPTNAAHADSHRRTAKAAAGGSSGFLRIDTVHQGDLDGRKDLYHINAVGRYQLRFPQWQ